MRLWPYLFLATAGLAWGVSFPMAALALKEIGPLPLMLLRFGVASAVCLPLSLRSKASRAAYTDPWVWVVGLLYATAFVLQFEGLKRATVTLSALMVGLLPALVALVAPLLGERVTPSTWFGVAAAALGAALIAAGPGAGGSLLGLLLLGASMVVNLFWLLTLRRLRPSRDLLAAPCASVAIATLALGIAVTAVHGGLPASLSPKAWVGIVGTGLISTALATIAWIIGAARVPSTTAGIFINIEPVVGASLGVLVFHDALRLQVAVGGLMIIAGSLLVVLNEDPAARTTSSWDAPQSSGGGP